MSVRSVLYTLARAIGDYHAVVKHRIGLRIERRLVGRMTARLLGWLFRGRR
jgi:hypothetical protein